MILNIVLYSFLAYLVYFIYSRLIRQYIEIWHLEKSGIPCFKQRVPFLGNTLRARRMIASDTKAGLYDLQFHRFLKEDFGDEFPPVNCIATTHDPIVIIRDPNILHELYVTKNKYFDKFERSKRILRTLMGSTLLFENSNELWAKKRKTVTQALYKEKLIKYFDLIK